VESLLLPNEVFASAVATEASQGVAALVSPPHFSLDELLKSRDPLLIGAAGVQDPGNLGTVIRSAEAFGATGVLLFEGTVSAFNPKTIRAAAGSLFRLPVITTKFSEISHKLREHGVRLCATSSHKGKSIEEADLNGGVCILIGNEGTGLPKPLLADVNETLVIPHASRVESLNAAMAATVILYEAARQRREKHGTV
jgi:TrmH family RNA methyltransferase